MWLNIFLRKANQTGFWAVEIFEYVTSVSFSLRHNYAFNLISSQIMILNINKKLRNNSSICNSQVMAIA